MFICVVGFVVTITSVTDSIFIIIFSSKKKTIFFFLLSSLHCLQINLCANTQTEKKATTNSLNFTNFYYGCSMLMLFYISYCYQLKIFICRKFNRYRLLLLWIPHHYYYIIVVVVAVAVATRCLLWVSIYIYMERKKS